MYKYNSHRVDTEHCDHCLCVSVCSYIHVEVARTNLYKNVVLRGSISYFLTTRSSQMNAEAANDVDPIY